MIEEKLDSAFAVIALWSVASVKSKWVRAEASAAAERDVLVPITVEKSNIPLRFRTLQTLDLTDWRGDRADRRLIDIEDALARRAALNGTGGTAPDVRPGEPSAPGSEQLGPVPTTETSPTRLRRWYSAAAVGIVLASSAILATRPWKGELQVSNVDLISPGSSSVTATTDSTVASNATISAEAGAPTSSLSVSTPQGTVPPYDMISMEAEDQPTTPPMTEFTDPQAQGAAFLQSSVLNSGAVRFDFTIVHRGRYWIWARVASASPLLDHNSLAVSLDHREIDVWDFFEASEPPGVGWHWELISLRCGGTFESHLCNPWRPMFRSGRHTLAFSGREPESALDAIVITNDGRYVPAAT